MKKSYIPNIRFTNFFNIWDIKKLKQIGLIKKGQQINKLKLKETGKYYVLNGGISPSGYFDMYNTPMNTISISEGGNSCGFVTLNKEHFWSGGHNYTLSNLSIDTNYLFQYLKKQEQFIMTLRTGSGLPNIQKSRLENIIIFFPQKEEQIKLSKFFLDLDVLIQQQKIKLEYLNQLKKAMLEKMFPKENSNIPELRFKGFTDVWEQRKLGDIMNITSVKRIHQSDWTDSGIRFLRARDIVSASKNEEPDDYLYISKEKYDEYSLVSGKVAIGDLLVTGVGTIGVPYLIRNSEPLYFKDGNIIWFQNGTKIDGYFFLYSFFGKAIQDFINESAGIGTVGTYTIESGKKTPISLPEMKEQQQIGAYFRNLDNLITLHQYMYNKLFQVKNDIFPLYSAFYSNILHNFLPIIFTYAQPQYKSHTKKIYWE